MKGPEFDLSVSASGPSWGEHTGQGGAHRARDDRNGDASGEELAANELSRIVEQFLEALSSAFEQLRQVIPLERELFEPITRTVASLDSVLATGDLRILDSVVEMLNKLGEVIETRISGSFGVDDFGFDEHFHQNVWLPLWRPLFEYWFRVEVIGADNIPDVGAGLIVSNHAGVLPLDGLMTTVAVNDHGGRALRLLAADLAMSMPFSATLARRAGVTLACNADAEQLLDNGHLVGVWPEGYKGLGKPFSDRYRLQRFGRGGFVATALKAGVPIIPCSIVGSEEIYPKIGEVPALSRLFGLPYLPVTPTFPLLGLGGAVPLPTKWTMEFGEPIDTSGYEPDAADDPMVVFELTDQVRETIQNTLFRNLARRGSVFFG